MKTFVELGVKHSKAVLRAEDRHQQNGISYLCTLLVLCVSALLRSSVQTSYANWHTIRTSYGGLTNKTAAFRSVVAH